MSKEAELKDKIRKLNNQLRKQKKINENLIKENRELRASFKRSIGYIEDNLEGKSVEEVLKDLREEGEIDESIID